MSGFIGGERDYKKLKGDTGPLVYPAGFLYVYAAIRYVTGGEVYSAQVVDSFPYLNDNFFFFQKLFWWDVLCGRCLSRSELGRTVEIMINETEFIT